MHFAQHFFCTAPYPPYAPEPIQGGRTQSRLRCSDARALAYSLHKASLRFVAGFRDNNIDRKSFKQARSELAHVVVTKSDARSSRVLGKEFLLTLCAGNTRQLILISFMTHCDVVLPCHAYPHLNCCQPFDPEASDPEKRTAVSAHTVGNHSSPSLGWESPAADSPCREESWVMRSDTNQPPAVRKTLSHRPFHSRH